MNIDMERQTVALWIRGKTKKDIKPKEKKCIGYVLVAKLNFHLNVFKTLISSENIKLYRSLMIYGILTLDSSSITKSIFDCFSLMRFLARYCSGCYVGMLCLLVSQVPCSLPALELSTKFGLISKDP